MWDEIIKTVGGMGLAVWLVRSVIKLYLSKDLEGHKARLRTESEKELEQLRASLHKVAYEHEVRFSRLHDKRALVVAEIYSRMVEAHLAVARLVALLESTDEPKREEKHEIAAKQINQFRLCLEKNRIYLSEGLCGEIEDLSTELAVLATELQLEFGTPRYRQTWAESFKSFREKLPPIRKLLEQEFRKILGVHARTEQDGTSEVSQSSSDHRAIT